MIFLDREEERARINRLMDAHDGALCCLYGRRRCGKSRLLSECAKGRANVFYHLADRAGQAAQISRFVREVSAQLPAFRVAAGSDWGAVLDLWMGLAPHGAILILDEFPYLVEQEGALPSIIQRLCDRLSESGKKIIICGSSQRMMQGFVLKQSEPLYGRAKEILPILPLTFDWMSKAFPAWTPFEILKAWGVWGGVPRYWELQSDEPDLWTAVRRNVCSPLGVLRNEPQFLLLDDYMDVAQASSVLSFIGEGANRASEIASRMNRPTSDLSRPLQRLMELGLIDKDIPFGADVNSKKTLYRISDNFLDFWYTHVLPNWSRYDFLETEEDRLAFDKRYRVYLGRVWERLVRDTILRKGIPDLGIKATGIGRWWGSGLTHEALEVDVVAKGEDNETLFVGEVKLSLGQMDAERELRDLENKVRQLPFAGKYKRTVTRLFVAEGNVEGAISLDWFVGR